MYRQEERTGTVITYFALFAVVIACLGLLGFSSYCRYALLQPNDEGIFYWLQSLDAPDLAFVVSDPMLWVPDYQTTIRREQMEELDLGGVEDF